MRKFPVMKRPSGIDMFFLFASIASIENLGGGIYDGGTRTKVLY